MSRWEKARSFVELALSIDQYLPGYVDAYYGPPEIRARVGARGKVPLEELSATLDPIVAAGIDNLIRKLQQTFELTSVVVTHEMKFAKEVADRIIMIDQGTIIESADPKTFFENPQQNLLCVAMPSFVMGIGSAGLLARYVRSSFLEILGQDFIRTAWAKGLSERAIVINGVRIAQTGH